MRMVAVRVAVDVLKFFPAEANGGIKTLSALAAVFSDVRFMPTGGISPSNLRTYLDLGVSLHGFVLARCFGRNIPTRDSRQGSHDA
jgi:2-keto-3-deoxy-6-phosphogluconate aldolase